MSVGYIRGLREVVSVGLRAIYIAPLVVDFSGVGGELSLLFWMKHPNEGLFLGPPVQVAKTSPESDKYDTGVLSLAPGFEVGWRWLWPSGFNIGLGNGLGYPINVAQDKERSPGYECTEIRTSPLYLLLDLGYAFYQARKDA